jgi:hypothetical protein
VTWPNLTKVKQVSHWREKIMSDIEHRYYRSFA